jgi:hypothetical protein
MEVRMKKLLILAIFLVCSNTASGDSGISGVFIKNDEIVVSTDDARQIQLTYDRTPKNHPVWSKDGTMIAFTEETDKWVALDRLVVISRDGKLLYNFLIHPVVPGLEVVGMRYVERIEWVTNSKIAVSGSINPFTVENIIFDLSTREISRNFLSDGYPVYSPDGLHVAYISPVPHFTPRSDRESELVVDNDQPVYPPVDTKVDFISGPAWSADGQTLAIVATILDTKISNIVIWHARDVEPSLVPLPIKQEKDRYISAKLFWKGDGVFVISDNQAWSFAQGRLGEISLSQAVNPKQDALNMKKKLETSHGVGPGQSDFWCQSCRLSSLPRRSPVFD